MSRLASMAGSEHTVTGLPVPLQDCPAMTGGGHREGFWRRRRRQVAGLVRETRSGGVKQAVDEVVAYARPRITLSKYRWRRAHDVAPNAVPVYVVGLQRSGTSMLMRGLDASPAVAVYSEGNTEAFEKFRIRPLPVIRPLIEASGQSHVVFKPLCDSHRVDELLDAMGNPSPGRAAWVYRGVDGRVRSSVGLFGANNLKVLTEIAGGGGRERWQAGGLSQQSLDLIASFDWDAMTPESASALFWYVRNSILFERGLADRDDVLVFSYDALVRGPERSMRRLCEFLGLEYDPRLIRHIVPKPPGAPRPRIEIDPRVRELCDELEPRLDRAAEAADLGLG